MHEEDRGPEVTFGGKDIGIGAGRHVGIPKYTLRQAQDAFKIWREVRSAAGAGMDAEEGAAVGYSRPCGQDKGLHVRKVKTG